jgi:phosphatidate cytidylyltransferase
MKERLRTFAALATVLAITVALDCWTQSAWPTTALLTAFLAAGALEGYRLLVSARGKARGAEYGCALLAVAGIVLPGVFLLLLRMRDRGLPEILYLVATAKMTDNGALFVGRLWGRHKLAPTISPNKTIEGLFGGLLAGVVTAVALAPVCTHASVGAALIFGILVSLFAVLGDLAESRLKRAAGVKDSGSLLPGIGGVLDLLDSILLCAPVGFLILQLFA